MAKSLSDASKARATTSRRKLNNTTQKAAKTVAQKLAGNASTAVTNVPVTTQPTAIGAANANIAVSVPGFSVLAPDAISGMLPEFNQDAYRITDPLNPPDTIPQATEAQHERGMKIYKGGIRALQLTGAAFDMTGEVFNVIGKRAKAFGKGIQTATETEKVVGNFVDYLTQKETNEQKIIKLERRFSNRDWGLA